MADMFEYLKWRGDLSFRQVPPNEVDALILSSLAYIEYGGRVAESFYHCETLREAAELFFTLDDIETRVRIKKDLELLEAAAETERFGMARLTCYRDILVPEQETQFAAMTFLLDDGTAFLAFRGTDDTLVGWKEDFNMSFQQTIPAQRLALQYTREVAAEFSLPLRLAGHSKGGNLAVFAGARSSPTVQNRILEIYNHDGPGFTNYLMGDPGYLRMVPKIRTYIPESSVIGMLLEHEEPYTVIKSKWVGLLQHDPYSWEIMGPVFLHVEEVSEDSRFVDATIKEWFADMTNQERNQLVDAMFTLLGTGGVDNAWDIFHPRNIGNYIKALREDGNIRRILSEEFQNLMEAAKKIRERAAQTQEKLELPEE